MDVLSAVVRENGAWCATVEYECRKGAVKPGLAAMGEAYAIFGDPLYPEGAEHLDIDLLQEQLRGPGDSDSAHLGEAETITIIRRRGLSAAFVTDDVDARRSATLEGIPTYTSWQILKLAVAAGLMTDAEFMVAYATLVDANRGHPPCGRSPQEVANWLAP
ncbi:hypothetical protein CH252_18860 [Rhodococcus sp. 06-1477-1B]|nr:hypothetical protein CH252_18860 [Rhodococcus sp. 06-1477-1B]